MSNETKEIEDQAAELRKLVDEVQQKDVKDSEVNIGGIMDGEREVDILNLPPRKEVHSKKNTRTHLKMSRPFLRLVFVIVIILAVLFGIYYVWGDEIVNVF
ncbi:hypothetical protein [Virgibacillus oceani]|uniref:Uncharacterized protein n=1 Tax=Virgibacillus oceani TaxID=1479511 RepID=A0A917H263_9BACI|nr:hypothetical protein [Virgibacillus oceani]GGG65050.1 hypothetical protein GCM10011398_05850 [Virgibacillus oceani]